MAMISLTIFSGNSFASVVKCDALFVDSNQNNFHQVADPNYAVKSFVKKKTTELQEAIKHYGLAFIINNRWVGDTRSSQLRHELYDDLSVYSTADITKGSNINKVAMYWGEGGRSQLEGPLHLAQMDAKLFQWLDGHKVSEWELANRIDPSIMPKTVISHQAIKNHELNGEIKERIQKALDRGGSGLASELHYFLEKYKEGASNLFSTGAIFKLDVEAQTGDTGSLITTENMTRVKISEAELNTIIKENNIHTTYDFVTYLCSNKVSRILAITGNLIQHYDKVLVQELVKIKKAAGQNVEIRVDFINGVAISADMRYGFGYLPKTYEEAIELINNFLYKAEKQGYANLSGGADVVLLEDGTLKVMEFNYGDQSGFRLPRLQPIEANWFITLLNGGKRTNLIAYLDKLFDKLYVKPSDTLYWQKELSQFSKNKLNTMDKRDDIYVADVIAFLRDIAVDEWTQGSDYFSNKDQVMAYVRNLVKSITNPPDQLNTDLQQLLVATREALDD
jgi:hypothetical protein